MTTGSQFLSQPMLHLHNNLSNSSSSKVKCADVFSFDDMLASCVAEIVKNGMDTLAIPDSIKDWVAGKLLRGMPKQLTQRLLSFMMEQRDFEGLLAFRECRTSDVPEFTENFKIYRLKHFSEFIQNSDFFSYIIISP